MNSIHKLVEIFWQTVLEKKVRIKIALPYVNFILFKILMGLTFFGI